MELSRLDKRVVSRCFASPLVVLPTAIGVLTLAGAWLFGGLAGPAGMIGAGLVVLGLGTAVVRWLFGLEGIRRAVRAAAAQEADRRHRAELVRLYRELRRDKDPRTGECLEKLRKLDERLGEARSSAGDLSGGVLGEVVEKAETLYHSSLASLKRSHHLWSAARAMATPEAKEELLQHREELIGEVAASVGRLETALDQLQAARFRHERGEEDDLARIRRELATGLEVARRVEERMAELDGGSGRPGVRDRNP